MLPDVLSAPRPEQPQTVIVTLQLVSLVNRDEERRLGVALGYAACASADSAAVTHHSTPELHASETVGPLWGLYVTQIYYI